MGIFGTRQASLPRSKAAHVDEIKKVYINKKELNQSKVKFQTVPSRPLLGLLGIRCYSFPLQIFRMQ